MNLPEEELFDHRNKEEGVRETSKAEHLVWPMWTVLSSQHNEINHGSSYNDGIQIPSEIFSSC